MQNKKNQKKEKKMLANQVKTLFSEKFITELNSYAENALTGGKKAHICVPICFGYSKAMSSQQFTHLVEELEKLPAEYTIFLNPKDEAALLEWNESNAETLKKIANNEFNPSSTKNNKVILLSDWCKSELGKEAAKRYLEVCRKNAELRITVAKCLKQDVENFCNRMIKKFSLTESEIATLKTNAQTYIVQEIYATLAWMQLENSTTPSPAINFLLYPYPLYTVIDNAIQHSGEMGYIPNSLIRYKYHLDSMEKKNNYSIEDENMLSRSEQQNHNCASVVLTEERNIGITEITAKEDTFNPVLGLTEQAGLQQDISVSTSEHCAAHYETAIDFSSQGGRIDELVKGLVVSLALNNVSPEYNARFTANFLLNLSTNQASVEKPMRSESFYQPRLFSPQTSPQKTPLLAATENHRRELSPVR